MMRKSLKFATLALCTTALSNCAFLNDLTMKEVDSKPIRAELYNGYNVEKALEISLDKNFYGKSNNRYLRSLEQGVLYYRNGKYYSALKTFERSQQLADEMLNTSVSDMLLGGAYKGEKYDISLMNFYLSLIHMHLYIDGYHEEYIDEDGNIEKAKKLSIEEQNAHLKSAKNVLKEWSAWLDKFKDEAEEKAQAKDTVSGKLMAGAKKLLDEILLNKEKKDIFNQDIMQYTYGSFVNYHGNNVDAKRAEKLLTILVNNEKGEDEKLDTVLNEYKQYPSFNADAVIKNAKANLEKRPNVEIVAHNGLVVAKSQKLVSVPFNGSHVKAEARHLIPRAVPGGILRENYLVIPEVSPTVGKNVTIKKDGKVIVNAKMSIVEPISEMVFKTFGGEDPKFEEKIKSHLQIGCTARINAAQKTYEKEMHKAKTSNNPKDVNKHKSAAQAALNVKCPTEASDVDMRSWDVLPNTISEYSLNLPDGKYEITYGDETKKIEVKDQKPVLIDFQR